MINKNEIVHDYKAHCRKLIVIDYDVLIESSKQRYIVSDSL